VESEYDNDGGDEDQTVPASANGDLVAEVEMLTLYVFLKTRRMNCHLTMIVS
jgi:hypothetical protein